MRVLIFFLFLSACSGAVTSDASSKSEPKVFDLTGSVAKALPEMSSEEAHECYSVSELTTEFLVSDEISKTQAEALRLINVGSWKSYLDVKGLDLPVTNSVSLLDNTKKMKVFLKCQDVLTGALNDVKISRLSQ